MALRLTIISILKFSASSRENFKIFNRTLACFAGQGSRYPERNAIPEGQSPSGRIPSTGFRNRNP